jgi:hypothetical protein
MPLAYALSGGIYFAQKPNRHACLTCITKDARLYNKRWATN